MSKVSESTAGYQTAQVAAMEAANTSNASKTSKVGGRTIGEPQLSDKAAKYYEELQRKNPDKEFILVSKDQKEFAQAQAASYANPNKMVVLIDEEKIERMATDASYRKKYEGIIADGANQLKQMAQKLIASGANVKSYGMQVNDNRASFFASVDKSFKDQGARLERRRAEKKAAKKAEEKKAAKKVAEDKRKERIEGKKADKPGKVEDEEPVTFKADSVDELIQRIDDYNFARMSDNIWTEDERKIGQHVDFSL